MVLSIREAALHKGEILGAVSSLRGFLGMRNGNVELRAQGCHFQIMTYNMALLGSFLSSDLLYKGTDRQGAISELISRIERDPPDVVGLCEVFDDDDREDIRRRLQAIYSHYREGPDEADIHEDGGLLILSRHPIITSYATIYRQSAGNDSFANKGAIQIRIHPTGCPTPWDIFLSHTQDIEPDGGKEALYSQLLHLDQMIRGQEDPDIPSLIIGDLNVPADVDAHYEILKRRLRDSTDLWTIKHPTDSGFTNTTNNNFYQDSSNAPVENHRLDYVLLKPGKRFLPLVDQVELLKWTHAGRQISDHFGLRARFNQLLEIGIQFTGTIARVSVSVIGFRCLETTNGLGADEVSFSVEIQGQDGTSVKAGTLVYEGIDAGMYREVQDMNGAVLDSDPGSILNIIVKGTEHDSMSQQDLGVSSIRVPRTELLLHKGGALDRAIPFLTGTGSEYGVEIRITVQ